MLDVACGTGIVARRAARLAGPGSHVIGIDRNPSMLEVARTAARDEGVRITWQQGDAAELEVPTASVDVIHCQQGLQFLRDRTRGAAQLRRVVGEGGRAVVAVWQGLDQHPLYAALAEAEVPHLTRFGVPVTYDDAVAPFSFGDPDALGELLVDVGFGDVEVVDRAIVARFPEPDRFIEQLEYAYAAVVPAFVEDPAAFATYLAAVTDGTRAIVDRYRDGDHIAVPMRTNLAVAVA